MIEVLIKVSESSVIERNLVVHLDLPKDAEDAALVRAVRTWVTKQDWLANQVKLSYSRIKWEKV